MPGAGKTFWGEHISAAYGYAFTDLDRYIEQKAGKTIGAVFADHGEDQFREMEQKSLRELVVPDDTGRLRIIACGGGTPCYFDNLQLMLDTGAVIYLRARIDTLLLHICQDDSMRPLLEHGALHDKLYHLMLHREPFYEQAHHIVDAENLSVATFGEIIRSCIKEH